MKSFLPNIDKDRPRSFIMVGRYHGRNKRSDSTFRVIDADLDAVKLAIEPAILKMLRSPSPKKV